MTYLYPHDLKAKANLWLWSLRDFVILAVVALASVVLLVQFHLLLPLALSFCFGVLSIRTEKGTVLDYISYAVRYFITGQQYYEWR